MSNVTVFIAPSPSRSMQMSSSENELKKNDFFPQQIPVPDS